MVISHLLEVQNMPTGLEWQAVLERGMVEGCLGRQSAKGIILLLK